MWPKGAADKINITNTTDDVTGNQRCTVYGDQKSHSSICYFTRWLYNKQQQQTANVVTRDNWQQQYTASVRQQGHHNAHSWIYIYAHSSSSLSQSQTANKPWQVLGLEQYLAGINAVVLAQYYRMCAKATMLIPSCRHQSKKATKYNFRNFQSLENHGYQLTCVVWFPISVL